MMNLRQWKRDTSCKLLALWCILTNRSVVYGLYFDAAHPLILTPRNLTPDTLVIRCVFDATGAPQEGYDIERLYEIYHQERSKPVDGEWRMGVD